MYNPLILFEIPNFITFVITQVRHLFHSGLLAPLMVSAHPRNAFIWSHLATSYLITLIAMAHTLVLDALLYNNLYYATDTVSVAVYLAQATVVLVIYGGYSIFMLVYFSHYDLLPWIIIGVMVGLKVRAFLGFQVFVPGL